MSECKYYGGKIAIIETPAEQMAVMEHIHKADATRDWKDRTYLLGGQRGKLPNSTLLGPWKWIQEDNAAGSEIQPLDDYLWANAHVKNRTEG